MNVVKKLTSVPNQIIDFCIEKMNNAQKDSQSKTFMVKKYFQNISTLLMMIYIVISLQFMILRQCLN